MKIVLVEDVENVGEAGDVREVKNGFARNYLIPRGLAVKATKNELQRIEALRKAAEAKRQKYAAEMSELAKQLDGQSVTLTARVGPTGRLYGSVTSQMIAEAVQQLTGQSISHRRVELSNPLRDLGEYQVPLHLAPQVTATITVKVEPEGGIPTAVPRASDRGTRPEEPQEQAPEASLEEQEEPAAVEESEEQEESAQEEQ